MLKFIIEILFIVYNLQQIYSSTNVVYCIQKSTVKIFVF